MKYPNLNLHKVESVTIEKHKDCWRDIRIMVEGGDTFIITIFSEEPITINMMD